MKPELLLPAGSVKSLERAVMSGADAVYLGLQRFNARASAENFDTSNLKRYVDYCHLFGVRVYVAFNISIKESEMSAALEDILAIDRAGADAIIVTDIGLISRISEIVPHLPVHISTQAGVCNLYGAKFFYKMGTDRAVLARETGRKDIEAIRDGCPIDMEYFVQGALCVSFSGACLMSSQIHGKSGNRGECLQPCRQLYTLKAGGKEKTGYMLSPADYCLIGRLKELEEMGIKSLKVEGRLRRPEYAAQAALSYRRVLDGISDKARELSPLKRAFNRGDYSEGYMFSDTSRLMFPAVQGHIGESAGRVLRTFARNGYPYAEVMSSIPLVKGGGLKILRESMEAGGAELHSVEDKGGGKYVIPVSEGVRPDDEIRLTTDKAANDTLNAIERKLDLSVNLIAKEGQILSIEMISGKSRISAEEDFTVPSAGNAPTSEAELKEQLSKLGDTEFILFNLKMDCSENIFVPKSRINSLRRKGIELLKAQILADYQRQEKKNLNKVINPPENPLRKAGRAIIAEYAEPAEMGNGGILSAAVFRPEDYSVSSLKDFLDRAEKACVKRIYLALPRLIRQEDMPLIMQLASQLKQRGAGILADNPGAVEFAREMGLPYIAGIGLNVYNLASMACLSDADYILASPELTESEAAPLIKAGAVIFAYGRLPLMHLSHCPIQLISEKGCGSCAYAGEFSYTDSKAEFPAIRSKLYSCTFTVYNSLPHNLSGVTAEAGSLYLDLKAVSCSPEEVLNVFYSGTRYSSGKSTLGAYGR